MSCYCIAIYAVCVRRTHSVLCRSGKALSQLGVEEFMACGLLSDSDSEGEGGTEGQVDQQARKRIKMR